MKVNINLPDNTALDITNEGCFLTYTIPIKANMIKHLYRGNCFNGKDGWYYKLRTNKPIIVNLECIYKAYERLKSNAMVNVRQAKIKALNKEIKGIQLGLNL